MSIPSTGDELSLSSSSSSSINSWRVDEGGANTTNKMIHADDNNNDDDAPGNDADDNNDDNATISSISERIFNWYAAFAKLDEEDWIFCDIIIPRYGDMWYVSKENNDLSSTNNGNNGTNMDYNIAWWMLADGKT